MDNCIFCKIAKHDAPAQIEAENDSVIAFSSIAPVAEHHIVIIPKKHITSFTDLDNSNVNDLSAMVSVAQDLIVKKGISDGYKMIFNGGHYQEIKHIHWHLLGGKLDEKKDTFHNT